jgi:hypothetical protein
MIEVPRTVGLIQPGVELAHVEKYNVKVKNQKIPDMLPYNILSEQRCKDARDI